MCARGCAAWDRQILPMDFASSPTFLRCVCVRVCAAWDRQQLLQCSERCRICIRCATWIQRITYQILLPEFVLVLLVQVKTMLLPMCLSCYLKDYSIIDKIMTIIADFILLWLPAPTVSLRPPVAVSAGIVAKYFSGCPDNAFQVALAGTSYSFLQTIGAIVPNGAKLFAVGTGASLFFEMPRHETIKALDTYKRAG
ncbi:hypothetical protein L2E82_15093 [Cichorium intybus]|uniref:Uncharacterized protein n=1 Tax=Cichorium intybus TaxID=13427 RepID=A0ACB9F1A6_CICIN|nr:hypothetical protein L2E82_15093 [Cichorium intybus]